jgi:uncharacterized membrane protein
MSRLVGYFARGALAVVPMAATIYILYVVVKTLDDLVGVSVPGLGIAIALGLITSIGFLVTGVVGRQVYRLFDKLMAKVPIVRLLYTSIRDLVSAIMGEEKKFGRPVCLNLGDEVRFRLLGFMSQESMPGLGLPDHAAVYVPQAYNIGGQVLLVPRDRIEPVDLPAASVFAFLLSGGAADLVPGPISSFPPGARASKQRDPHPG